MYMRICLGLLCWFRFRVSWIYCPVVPLFLFHFLVTIFSALVFQYQKYIQWSSNLYFNQSHQNMQIAWHILNSVNGKHWMTSLSLCGRHFKEKGKWAREMWGKEGGKCLPYRRLIFFLHYKHQPGECWNHSLLPRAFFAFVLCPKPLSLSF